MRNPQTIQTKIPDQQNNYHHPQKSTVKKGKLIIFAAPSGAGKTTLVRHLLKYIDNLVFSVSATTRPRRTKEVDGKDYYFISPDEFKQRIQNGDFVEWQEVYDGNYYGTLTSEVDHLLDMGKNVIFDVDVQGALNLKEHYKDRALAVFVEPPSVDVLRVRLNRRNTETPESLERRVQKAASELKYLPLFDTSVYNDDLTTAKMDAKKIVSNFLLKL